MNSTTVTHDLRKQHWIGLIRECKASGRRVDEWCLEHGISRHAYYYWHRKLQDLLVTELMESHPQLPVFAELKPPAVPMPATSPAIPEGTAVSGSASAIIRSGNISIAVMDSASSELMSRLPEAASHVQ